MIRRSSSPTAARSPAASPARAGASASARSPCSATPTPARCTSRSCDAAVHLPGVAPADTYLRGDLLVDAARRAGADAVHPGYGFLAESADVRPGRDRRRPDVDRAAAGGDRGDGLEDRGQGADARGRRARCCPTPSVADIGEIGLPLLVKASAGGGGRGMRIVRTLGELDEARADAEREAAAAFGDGTVFCERYVERGRHVEIQVFGDTHGTVVSLLERDCSIQRRHQKIVEESPVAGRRRRRCGGGWPTPRSPPRGAVGYVGAGTVEFLLEPDGRLLVPRDEHPAAGRAPGHRAGHRARPRRAAARRRRRARRCPTPRSTPALDGHAIEVRLTAEDPAAGYRPSTGTFTASTSPARVRVDTGVEAGSAVSPHYDSMVAKVIAHAPTRDGAIRALRGALVAARLHGPVTNRDQLRARPRATRRSSPATCTPASSTSTRAPTRSVGDVGIAAAAAALAEQAANRRGRRRARRRSRRAGATTRPSTRSSSSAHGERPVRVTLPPRARRARQRRRRAARRHASSTADPDACRARGRRRAPPVRASGATATSASSTPTTAT